MVVTARTAELDAPTLAAARTLLEQALDGDFSDHDWEHALGGLHALVWDGEELIGHGSLVQRRLLHRGRALRAGYVEAVAVRANRRGQGFGAAMMAALEQAIDGAYEVGALSTTDAAAGFYVARGWRVWRGATFVMADTGLERTPGDDDGVHVWPGTAELDLDGDIACDWRAGDLW